MARYSDRSDPNIYRPDGEPWRLGPGEIVTPTRKRRAVWPWILLGVVLLLCGIMVPILALAGDSQDKQLKGSPTSTPTTIEPPTKTGGPSKKAVAEKKKTSVDDGEWLVGEDVPSGRYRTTGAEDSIITFCTWTILDKEDGNPIDFGTSSETNAPGRVTLKKGNVFQTTGCKPWTRQDG